MEKQTDDNNPIDLATHHLLHAAKRTLKTGGNSTLAMFLSILLGYGMGIQYADWCNTKCDIIVKPVVFCTVFGIGVAAVPVAGAIAVGSFGASGACALAAGGSYVASKIVPFRAIKSAFHAIHHHHDDNNNTQNSSSTSSSPLLASESANALLEAKRKNKDNQVPTKAFHLPTKFAVLLNSNFDGKDEELPFHLTAVVTTDKHETFIINMNKSFNKSIVVTKGLDCNAEEGFPSKRIMLVDFTDIQQAYNVSQIVILVQVDDDTPDYEASITVVPITHEIAVEHHLTNDGTNEQELLDYGNMEGKKHETESKLQVEQHNNHPEAKQEHIDEVNEAMHFFDNAKKEDLYLVRYSTTFIHPCKSYALCRITKDETSKEWIYSPLRAGLLQRIEKDSADFEALLVALLYKLEPSGTFRLIDLLSLLDKHKS